MKGILQDTRALWRMQRTPGYARIPIISGIHIMPWAKSSHKAVTYTPPLKLYARGWRNDSLWRESYPCNLYVLSSSFVSNVWILRTIQNRFRAKNRKSKRFIKLHANKKVNKNLKIFTQKIFFSSFENKFWR